MQLSTFHPDEHYTLTDKSLNRLRNHIAKIDNVLPESITDEMVHEYIKDRTDQHNQTDFMTYMSVKEMYQYLYEYVITEW